MKLRQFLGLGAILILGFVLGGVFSWQPLSAQQNVQQMKMGRYQVAAFGRDSNNAGMVVIDTTNGQCWRKIGLQSASWDFMGSPVQGRGN